MAILAPLLFGSAATATTAATTGLIGTAGAFAITPALITAGTGLLATSAIQQGRASAAQGKFTKQIALRNQQAIERQTKAEKESSRIKERRIARREKIVTGRQIAAAGKSGGQIAGATLNVLADTARQFSLSRNFALRAGLFRGQELKERGGIIAAEGRFAKSIGVFQKRTSFIKAGGTVLAGVGLARI